VSFANHSRPIGRSALESSVSADSLRAAFSLHVLTESLPGGFALLCSLFFVFVLFVFAFVFCLCLSAFFLVFLCLYLFRLLLLLSSSFLFVCLSYFVVCSVSLFLTLKRTLNGTRPFSAQTFDFCFSRQFRSRLDFRASGGRCTMMNLEYYAALVLQFRSDLAWAFAAGCGLYVFYRFRA
jgi:hypothetical protein